MADKLPTLPDGYSTVPRGKIVNAVTCLEMLEKPASREQPSPTGHSLERMVDPDLKFYRSLFRDVGEDWMWVSRLTMSDAELGSILRDPRVECYVLLSQAGAVGLLELDFRQDDECEIVFFGLIQEATGKGAGRLLMNQALSIAWGHPIRRLWLHTCHFDSPSALPFYTRSGFRPYGFMVEVVDDPRISGVLPRTAAPHIPLIE